jgi:hypothetical protein
MRDLFYYRTWSNNMATARNLNLPFHLIAVTHGGEVNVNFPLHENVSYA